MVSEWELRVIESRWRFYLLLSLAGLVVLGMIFAFVSKVSSGTSPAPANQVNSDCVNDACIPADADAPADGTYYR